MAAHMKVHMENSRDEAEVLVSRILLSMLYFVTENSLQNGSSLAVPHEFPHQLQTTRGEYSSFYGLS